MNFSQIRSHTGIILTKAQSLMNFGQDQFLSKFVLPGWVVNTRILGQVITQGLALKYNSNVPRKLNKDESALKSRKAQKNHSGQTNKH